MSAPPQGVRSRDPSGRQRPRGPPRPPRLTEGRPYPAQAKAASRRNPASPQLALPARLPSEALPPVMRRRPGAGTARSHARGHIRHLPPRASGATAHSPSAWCRDSLGRARREADWVGGRTGPRGRAALLPPAHACAAAGERAVASAGAERGHAGCEVPRPAPGVQSSGTSPPQGPSCSVGASPLSQAA